jgi:hypothetical protein
MHAVVPLEGAAACLYVQGMRGGVLLSRLHTTPTDKRAQRLPMFDRAVWANYPESRHPFEVEREVKL